jgi:hypothetical protein
VGNPPEAGRLSAAPVDEITRALAARYPGMTPDEAEAATAQLLRKLAVDLDSGKSVGAVYFRPDGSVDVEKFDIVETVPGGQPS